MAVSEKQIDSFIGFVTCGVDFWKRAGEKLVTLKRKDEGVFADIVRQVDWLTVEMLETLHEIGLGNLEPRILLLPHRLAAKVAEQPLEVQRVAVEAYQAGGSGESDLAPYVLTNRKRHEGKEAGLFYITVLNGKAFAKQAGRTNRKPHTVRLVKNEALVRFIT